MSAWADQEILDLVCQEKWQETPDVVSFELVSDSPLSFDFKPGQFANLGFEMDGKTQYRSYSISSTPSQNKLCFTVKKVAGGKVSQHVVERLKVGDTIQAMKPQGQFNSIDCAVEQKKVLLISAGCGITPVMSMAKSWLEQGDIDITFLHVARDKAHTIYFSELESLNEQYSQFHLHLLLKDAVGTEYPQGRLNQAWLEQLIPDLHQRTVFLCGPVSFMQDVQHYLQALQFNMQNFYQESFTPSTQEQPITSQTKSQVTVKVPAFGVEVDAPSNSVLLEALETGKLPIIAACRSGICGSCKCQVKQGSVRSTSQETLTNEEIAQGYVLACSAIVESDVDIALL
ncbi:FAD-binding oxidoreductase [Vibrio cincinnatiensis]|jgi:NADH oxidoreductase Hcr|uniref:hybrid-cluster NAD(P)-dependent oxidoreductase n=1 Tax=Vibrio cincinnatiensis TaxID=675 RepID=UPI001EE0AA47|nr:hybrid-cluster NAD(P)-dependent oxidoreductase [Vibrio cincinnatiensis]MCG3723470.1 hybrid-cluster NAD(P)-dependent oxidoreductase [Vibrio cincinnatiensis]